MEFTFYNGFVEMLKEQGIEAAADYALSLGLTSVEFLEFTDSGYPEAVTTEEEAKHVREVLESKGMRVACYSVGTTVYQNEDAVLGLMRHAEIAAALGSPFLHHTLLLWLTVPENGPTLEEGLKIASDAAIRVAKHAEKLGITCIYEDQGMYVNGVENFGKFYSAVKAECKNVGVCGDVGNILFVDGDPEAFFRAYASEIKHVHIKDYIKKGGEQSPGSIWMPTKGGNWLRDTMIGSGCIDFKACLDVLKEVGYKGPYALELCHPEPFEEGIRQAVEYLSRLA